MREDKAAEAKSWLSQAQTEFSDALDLEKKKRFYLALFLYQQATEKALKAYLFFNGEQELFTHSVNDLIALAVSIDESFVAVKRAKDLDRYYIPTRYPNGLAGNTPAEFFDDPEECAAAQARARAVIDLIRKKVGKQLE